MADAAHNQKVIAQFTRWAKPFSDLPIHAEAEAMERTLTACALDDAMTVLDVACGPGILACALADHACSVTGVDITPAMIEQARARQAASGRTNLSWRVGDACALPFKDATFDRVTTRYSFHHMPEPSAVLSEMKRVCRPGGRIVVIDATPSPQTQQAYDLMERLRDPSHASALTVEALRRIGRDAGLSEILIDEYRLEAQLDTLSDKEDMPALSKMFEADIASGEDRLGVGARLSSTGIRFHFPVSIVAWTRC